MGMSTKCHPNVSGRYANFVRLVEMAAKSSLPSNSRIWRLVVSVRRDGYVGNNLVSFGAPGK